MCLAVILTSIAKRRKCAACGTLLFRHLGLSGHSRCRHPELLADLISQVQFSNTAHQPCTTAMSSSTLSGNPTPPQGNPPPPLNQQDEGSLSDVSSAHTRSQTPVSSQESATNVSTLSSASGGSHTTQVRLQSSSIKCSTDSSQYYCELF